jgi:hypothetical protein
MNSVVTMMNAPSATDVTASHARADRRPSLGSADLFTVRLKKDLMACSPLASPNC